MRDIRRGCDADEREPLNVGVFVGRFRSFDICVIRLAEVIYWVQMVFVCVYKSAVGHAERSDGAERI